MMTGSMAHMRNEIVLEVRGISHSFGNHRVLTDVTFSIRRGQIAGIIGENGSGKSTLLKIIAGLLQPEKGEVRVEGRIGYCPQGLHLYAGLTVREHFRLFGTAYDLRAGIASPADVLLRTFRFGQYADRRVADLSGGTQQKLNLSLAILHSPDLLILDEPYSGFDMETYLRFWEFARGAKASGKSLLIVSHIAYDRADFDALYSLEQGVISCA
jgi:ABC-2 type transport system ATP-binding protein